MPTLSLLKMLRNWRKPAVQNLTVYCGATWHLRKKPQYRYTALQYLTCITAPKIVLENLLTVWLLVRTNLFVPSHFWTPDAKFDNCCQRYIATCGKKLYRCTSTFSALNYCGEILFRSQSHSYLYEVARTHSSADFWTVRNFFSAIWRKLWRHLAMKMRTL